MARESKGCGLEDLIPLISGQKVKEAWETGNVDAAPMMMGQSVGLIKDILSCKEVIERMVKEAEKELEHAVRLFKA